MKKKIVEFIIYKNLLFIKTYKNNLIKQQFLQCQENDL